MLAKFIGIVLNLVSSKGFKNKILELSPKSKVMYFPNLGVKIIEYNENKKYLNLFNSNKFNIIFE